MNWYLVGSIYGRSSINLLISSRSVNKHGHHRPFLFLIGWFLKKSSPLKALGQMNQNLVGSILGRSSIKWVWKGSKRDTWMAFFRKHDTWKTENIDMKTWSLVQRDPWKIIILYVNAWKSNLLLSVKTNQSPYSDASLHQNLICDSTFLLLHPVLWRLFTLDSLTS